MSRPRPSFLERCWPDWRSDPSVIKFRDGGDEVGGYPLCYGHAGQVEEGLKSFPSGHSSWTAAGLGFLSLALAAQLQVLGTAGGAPGRAWALLLALMPSAGAVAVAITRVIDYWHHPTDVGAGLLLGFGTAALSFAQLRHAVLPAFATATTGGGANGMPFGLISSPSKRNLSLVASAGPSSSAV